MRKELTPEMFNYYKYPGPSFVHFDNQVKSDTDLQFTLVENVKEAFDTEAFGQRFSDILLKYDYIVGDWGNDQLRLRGFYKDAQDVKRSSRISRLEDYLKEYCNYGCAYFILENPNPEWIVFEEEKEIKSSRRKRKGRGLKVGNRPQENRQEKNFTRQKRKDKSRPKESSALHEKSGSQPKSTKQFIIRKKKKHEG